MITDKDTAIYKQGCGNIVKNNLRFNRYIPVDIIPHKLLILVAVSILSGYYINVVAFYHVGYLVSLFVFFLICLLLWASFKDGMMLLLFFSLITPYYSRNLFHLYKQGDSWSNTFFTILTVKLFGVTLINVLFVLAGAAALFHIIWYRKKIPVGLLLFQCYMLSGVIILLVGVYGQEQIFPRMILSDLQYPVVFLLGTLAGLSFVDVVGRTSAAVTIVKLLWLAFIINGIRGYFFIVSDIYNGINSFVFCANSLLLIPFVFLCLTEKSIFPKKIGAEFWLFIFLSPIIVLPLGRGLWLILFLDALLLLAVTLSYRSKRIILEKFTLKICCYLLLLICTFTVLLVFLRPNILNFILYKLSFFSHLLNATVVHATPIRVYEFKNIIAGNYNSGLLGLFFGQGAGGSFTFSHYGGPPVKLGLSAYSEAQINQGVFFSPHTFINYWLLKGGVFGLIWYVGGVIYVFIYTLKQISYKKKLRSRNYLATWLYYFSPVALWSGWWLPVLSFMFSFSFSVLAGRKNSKKTESMRTTIL